jgi:hypothetical protein
MAVVRVPPPTDPAHAAAFSPPLSIQVLPRHRLLPSHNRLAATLQPPSCRTGRHTGSRPAAATSQTVARPCQGVTQPEPSRPRLRPHGHCPHLKYRATGLHPLAEPPPLHRGKRTHRSPRSPNWPRCSPRSVRLHSCSDAIAANLLKRHGQTPPVEHSNLWSSPRTLGAQSPWPNSAAPGHPPPGPSDFM